jgi:cytochrome P450
MSRAATQATRRTPPEMPRQAVVGNMFDMREPFKFFMDVARTGDVVKFQMPLWKPYFISRPEYIEHVLSHNYQNYNKDTLHFVFLVFGQGMASSEGELWKRQRRLAQPIFRHDSVKTFVDLMTQTTHEVCDKLKPYADTGEPIKLDTFMRELTLGVAARSLFGMDIDPYLPEIHRIVGTASEFLGARANNPFVPNAFPTPLNLRLKSAMADFRRLVDRIIAERLKQPGDHDDLLSMIIQAHDESGEKIDRHLLQDEVMTLIVAGFDTTAAGLTWSFYLLSKYPEADHKLRTELDSALGGRTPAMEDLRQIPYPRMVFQEALRLYPPIWIIARKALGDDRYGDYDIPAGSEVAMSPWVMHRHPEYWENPEGFDPERFTPERVKARPEFAYLPFGGGPRVCVGNHFALLEGQVAMAVMAQRYRFHLVPGHPYNSERGIPLRFPKGTLMTIYSIS